jgi:hypothetical protein
VFATTPAGALLHYGCFQVGGMKLPVACANAFLVLFFSAVVVRDV